MIRRSRPQIRSLHKVIFGEERLPVRISRCRHLTPENDMIVPCVIDQVKDQLRVHKFNVILLKSSSFELVDNLHLLFLFYGPPEALDLEHELFISQSA